MTWRHARDWGLEAMRVVLSQAGRVGPKAYGNNWPDIPKDWHAYDPKDAPRVRILPSPERIAQSDAFFEVMNTHLSEEERKTLGIYLASRCSKGRSVRKYCYENDIKPHVFKRDVEKAFHRIAKISPKNVAFVKKKNFTQAKYRVKTTKITEGVTVGNTWQSNKTHVPPHMGTKEEQRARLEQKLLKLREARERA